MTGYLNNNERAMEKVIDFVVCLKRRGISILTPISIWGESKAPGQNGICRSSCNVRAEYSFISRENFPAGSI